MKRAALLATAVLWTGCNLGLDPPTLVVTPRILAIVAEPPEAAPGDEIVVSVLAYDPMARPLVYSFEICIDPAAILDPDASSSTDSALCFPLEADGFRATVPAARTQFLATVIDGLTPAQTGGFDPAVLREIFATAGIPMRIRVEVRTAEGELLVSGHKLVGISRRAALTTNPPPPTFDVENVPYAASVDVEHSFDCASLTPETVPPDTDILIEPSDDPELWLETYPIYDFTGGVREGREGAYYSWYATAGVLEEETTQRPDEEVLWRSPREAGVYRLWVIVRDGHLGSSACTFELEVR